MPADNIVSVISEVMQQTAASITLYRSHMCMCSKAQLSGTLHVLQRNPCSFNNQDALQHLGVPRVLAWQQHIGHTCASSLLQAD